MNINDDESLRVDDKPWIVQKFGGTSIGKYPLNVVENVIKYVSVLFYMIYTGFKTHVNSYLTPSIGLRPTFAMLL